MSTSENLAEISGKGLLRAKFSSSFAGVDEQRHVAQWKEQPFDSREDAGSKPCAKVPPCLHSSGACINDFASKNQEEDKTFRLKGNYYKHELVYKLFASADERFLKVLGIPCFNRLFSESFAANPAEISGEGLVAAGSGFASVAERSAGVQSRSGEMWKPRSFKKRAVSQPSEFFEDEPLFKSFVEPVKKQNRNSVFYPDKEGCAK